MKLLFIALFFGMAVSNCGQKNISETTTNAENVSQKNIALSYGESVTRENVTLKFSEISEDSRCPTGTTCVWAGRAIAKIEVTANGKSETKTVIFGATRPGETADMQLYTGNGMTITADSLNPYPEQSGAIPKNNYVLNISVE